MKVVRPTTLRRDGICKESYKEYTSENFEVEELYKTICNENCFEETKINNYFVIYETN